MRSLLTLQLRQAARGLRRNPTFTTAVLVTSNLLISFTPAKTSPPTDEIQFIQIAKTAPPPKMWTQLYPEQKDFENYTTQADPASGVKGGYHVDINPVGKPGMPSVRQRCVPPCKMNLRPAAARFCSCTA